MSTDTLLNTERLVDADFNIEIASHYIRVTRFSAYGRTALLEFCRGMAQYGLAKMPGKNNRFTKKMLRVFVATTGDRTEFCFHRHQLDDLIRHLTTYGFRRERILFVERPRYEAAPFTLEYIDPRTPRDIQKPFIDYILQPGHTKIVTLDPGVGKTFITLTAMRDLKVRTVFIIKPMYIQKWFGDVQEAYRFKPGDVITVSGSAQLKTLTQLAATGQLNASIIIISNMTFFNYLKDYERFKGGVIDLGYACIPRDLFPLMKVGLRVIDEVHQDYHLNFRQDLYSHVDRTVCLSGTLEHDDPFMNKMYDIQFPPEYRIANGERKKYREVIAFEYRLNNPNLLKFINKSRKSYSQVMFEQSLMKNKGCLQNYLKMISTIITRTFTNKRQDNQKLLVYAATVEMCTTLAKYLKPLYPHLNVQRYVSEDDYDEMMEADLIVSTLKSLGTAIDIPDLYKVLMTDALGSRQSNLQALGRLRDLKHKWPDTEPVFMYFVCVDIDKHIEYHNRKVETFKDRVLSHKSFATDFVV